MRIEEIAQVSAGTLVSRLKEDPQGKTYYLYDQYAHAKDQIKYLDYNHEYKPVTLSDTKNLVFVERDDLIVNLSSCEVAYPDDEHVGFILPYNYCKIVIKEDAEVAQNYIRSWFNESPEAKKQLHLITQGASLVKKLSIQQIKQLNITLPDIEKQRLIGKIYYSRQIIKFKQLHKQHLLDILISNTLYTGGNK
ncbi:hypothetical protein [Macrococcus armenti]|uniref:Restriction endonuclease subunit S n=1 Tax=Macrococcus armenti TaxID=2875764 RepID=A0ABY3ZVG1_9STAP|nr:hypothetical protein [Macrococcus armenti]UOB20897.1 hypothetical protein MRZ06_02110 [Macrococcus armenti]